MTVLNLVPETHLELLTSRLTAVLTTVGPRQRPQSTAVWYLVGDDGVLFCSTTSTRQKYRNLLTNPYVAFLVIDPDAPMRTLEVRARVEVTPDPDNTRVAQLARAYGIELAAITATPGDRYTLTLHPYRVIATP
ncbi:TIGR03618 family F420-dependent PPOX class oxidoreductase [Gordonia sp. ABSL11-1]|uniref:TIGR03618 family F420-dependent PPOX class oxidoreductase n=1 Tax=Gordonia sp. ABSL11-1 TaxID=3053924 RepID=UPI002572D59A|nr:TIGR03618 family F420-dependent PPOX class oxidoreductase [Gordonia sp. ABSL11-1]MDL9945796.1 TIGR03618 family F420-dependent PPOX class oxidoreductase [Gordonia sp. ABSL11-1]